VAEEYEKGAIGGDGQHNRSKPSTTPTFLNPTMRASNVLFTTNIKYTVHYLMCVVKHFLAGLDGRELRNSSRRTGANEQGREDVDQPAHAPEFSAEHPQQRVGDQGRRPLR